MIYSRSPSVGEGSFQLTIREGRSDISFNYRDVLFNDPNSDDGKSATIGVEDARGRWATVYSYDEPKVHNGMALRFSADESRSYKPEHRR